MDNNNGNDNTMNENNNQSEEKTWIRGVNIGGWLMAERFITPYLFAVNSCHLQGSLCWYPDQIGSPPNLKQASRYNVTSDNSDVVPDDYKDTYHTLCDMNVCQPILTVKAKEPVDYHERNWKPYWDYPVDEYTLGSTLRQSVGGIETATKYMERHWDTFLTHQDIKDLANAGVTHLRSKLFFRDNGIEERNNPKSTIF
jgi:glucan 1,3-beta-glucosidase